MSAEKVKKRDAASLSISLVCNGFLGSEGSTAFKRRCWGRFCQWRIPAETRLFGKSNHPKWNESGYVMQTIESPTTASGTETCPYCGTVLPRGANECTRCDWVRQQPDAVRRKPNPRDTAALCLSIVPGAGHFFKGYDKLAILFFAGIPVIALLAYAFTMFFGWLMIPAYWVAVAADAYVRKDIRPPTPGIPLRK
jgi:hypothetical protein